MMNNVEYGSIRTLTINTLVKNLGLELDKLEIEIESLSCGESDTQDELVVRNAYQIQLVKDFYSNWKSYCRNFDIIVEKDVNSKYDVEELVKEVERLNRENLTLKNINNALITQSRHIKEMNSLIEDNIKTIAFKEYTKNDAIDKSGINSPRYRKDVDDEELLKDYDSGMSQVALAEKYNMTQPGVRSRLVKGGRLK